MFESIIGKVRKPEKVVWNSPKFITLEREDDDKNLYTIYKGAETYLYKKLGIKPGTSKEVYKLSENIWHNLMNLQMDKAKDNEPNSFSMTDDSTIYIVDDNNNLIDVFNVYSEEYLQEFKNKLNKYVIDVTTDEKTRKFFTDGKDGTLKLVCYNKNLNIVEEPYTPVVILELNTVKSVYNVYTGILIYSTFTFIPNFNPVLSEDKFSSLVDKLDIMECLKYAEDGSSELYETYTKLLENDIEISARELLSLLKHLGYKLALKDDNQLGEITNLVDEEANLTIQNFFNTFVMITDETAMDILSMSDLQRIFRYNKLTFMEVLKILSKEYLTYEGSKITADILGNIITDVYSKKTDRSQANKIIKENKIIV